MSKQTVNWMMSGLPGWLATLGLFGCFAGDPHYERECDPDIGRECKAGCRCVTSEKKCYLECSQTADCPQQEAQACLNGMCVQYAATCTLDSDCVEGWVCDGGACGKRRELGTACARPEECWSGFCSDGVCCEEACTGLCRSCLAAHRERTQGDGLCDYAARGLDPDNECVGATACDGAGACLPPRLKGQGCEQNYECVSGLCADNVCWSVAPTYYVGGTVSGFPGGELHVVLNGTELQIVTANGPMPFPAGS